MKTKRPGRFNKPFKKLPLNHSIYFADQDVAVIFYACQATGDFF